MSACKRLAVFASVLLSVGCAPGDGSEDETSAASTDALSAASPGGFAFASDRHEKRRSIPITRSGERQVIYSVRVDGLTPGERLAVTGEVTLSLCEPSEGAPCKRDTPFVPKLTARIVLGSSETDASGPALSKTPSLDCSRRDHHCTLSIPEEVSKGFNGKKFVNLVVSSESGAATSQDLMIVEEGHGGVYVTRMGAAAEENGIKNVKGKDVSPATMIIDNVDQNGNGPRRDGYVTLRARLDGVRPGDIVSADAMIPAKVDDGSCDPLIAHSIVVSKDDSQNPDANVLVPLTAHNGTNCLDAECRYQKSGAGELPKNTPSTVYVSVVSKAGRSCVQPGDKWSLGASSQLTVRVRR